MKILVVAMLDGVHTARWLSQFRDEDHEFLLFPSSPNRRIHYGIKDLLSGTSKARFRAHFSASFLSPMLWLVDKMAGNRIRGFLLSRAIKTFRPGIVHAIEMTNAGLIVLRALEYKNSVKFKLITTNWGSDLHHFGSLPRYRSKLGALLAVTDAYSCECYRDVALAKELGYSGEVLPVIPNAGGFSPEILRSSILSPTARKSIAVKGYDGWAGRATLAIQALSEIPVVRENYQLEVFSANWKTQRLIKKISHHFKFAPIVYPKFRLKHSEILDLMNRSKVYIGLSITDGISTSMLEAMAMGAIPIQTSTACCDEWFSNTGVSVKGFDKEEITKAVLDALKLAETQAASNYNREVIKSRANSELVFSKAKSFYV